jgi:hypothetical protein
MMKSEDVVEEPVVEEPVVEPKIERKLVLKVSDRKAIYLYKGDPDRLWWENGVLVNRKDRRALTKGLKLLRKK